MKKKIIPIVPPHDNEVISANLQLHPLYRNTFVLKDNANGLSWPFYAYNNGTSFWDHGGDNYNFIGWVRHRFNTFELNARVNPITSNITINIDLIDGNGNVLISLSVIVSASSNPQDIQQTWDISSAGIAANDIYKVKVYPWHSEVYIRYLGEVSVKSFASLPSFNNGDLSSKADWQALLKRPENLEYNLTMPKPGHPEGDFWDGHSIDFYLRYRTNVLYIYASYYTLNDDTSITMKLYLNGYNDPAWQWTHQVGCDINYNYAWGCPEILHVDISDFAADRGLSYNDWLHVEIRYETDPPTGVSTEVKTYLVYGERQPSADPVWQAQPMHDYDKGTALWDSGGVLAIRDNLDWLSSHLNRDESPAAVELIKQGGYTDPRIWFIYDENRPFLHYYAKNYNNNGYDVKLGFFVNGELQENGITSVENVWLVLDLTTVDKLYPGARFCLSGNGIAAAFVDNYPGFQSE